MSIESQSAGKQNVMETGSTIIGAETSADKNSQIADKGEFDQLLNLVNGNLAELGMQEDEDSAGMVGALTEIANAGNQEYRIWACKMLNWHNEMSKFIKGCEK